MTNPTDIISSIIIYSTRTGRYAVGLSRRPSSPDPRIKNRVALDWTITADNERLNVCKGSSASILWTGTVCGRWMGGGLNQYTSYVIISTRQPGQSEQPEPFFWRE